MPRKKKHYANTDIPNKLHLSKADESDSFIKTPGNSNLLKVEKSPALGRYLVAARFLKANQVILRDEAIVVGPCQESLPMCIGCYVNIDLKNFGSYQRCKNCWWPLCSHECSGFHKNNGHSKEECDCLSKSLIKNKDVQSFSNYFYALTPFRCLILKKMNSEMWTAIRNMESHTDIRKRSENLWKTNEKMAVNVICNEWGLSEFEEDDIHFVCGVLEVNAFEVNMHESRETQCLRAIYPFSFLFAHNCIPNVCHSSGERFQMIFRATKSIKQNEPVTISYAYTLQPTLKRRKHLEKTKFFSCQCRRCSDPTELGTLIGAVKCCKCRKGIILPTEPLKNDSIWKCSTFKCDKEMRESQINELINKLFEELDSINGNDVIGYERFLQKCLEIFHENHYLCLSAMHCLSKIYGKIDGYLINDMSNELLKRKVEICEKLLEIFEHLQLGLSKEKGTLYYELHAPLMILLKREYENGKISVKEMKKKLREIIKYLEDSRSILETECNGSTEGMIAKAAEEAIQTLKASMK